MLATFGAGGAGAGAVTEATISRGSGSERSADGSLARSVGGETRGIGTLVSMGIAAGHRRLEWMRMMERSTSPVEASDAGSGKYQFAQNSRPASMPPTTRKYRSRGIYVHRGLIWNLPSSARRQREKVVIVPKGRILSESIAIARWQAKGPSLVAFRREKPATAGNQNGANVVGRPLERFDFR